MGEVILNDWWYQVREGARQGRAGVCVADQKQLYSSISAMKIATHVKVDVFTEKRTRKKKTERKRAVFRGELCNLYAPGSHPLLHSDDHNPNLCPDRNNKWGGNKFYKYTQKIIKCQETQSNINIFEYANVFVMKFIKIIFKQKVCLPQKSFKIKVLID